ncbi:MAG TPA: PIN domain-containing protein [Candidatus Binatia bacterium]
MDAAYYIAMLNPQDDLHDRAMSVSRSLGDCIFVTTEMILTEVLNYFAERGAMPRQLAANFVQQIRQDPNTRVVPQTSAQFEDALELYRSRPDKEWSHTDCASFRVMEQEDIAEALTYDRHFEQAGFKALLRL